MENLVFISGRLTKDAELKYFESGKCKTTFNIAVDNYINKEKITSFFNCVLWDRQAEFAAEYFKKGKNVSVFGELKKEEYKEKEYYTIHCRTANFAGSQMVVKGKIVFVGENKIKIACGECVFEAENFKKDLTVSTDEKTFVLNIGLKDYKPVYSVVAIL